MQISNLTEQLVTSVLEEAMASDPQMCQCQGCKKDVYALALKNLPTKYAGSRQGEVVLGAELQSVQSRIDAFKAVRLAMNEVKNRPHHGRKP